MTQPAIVEGGKFRVWIGTPSAAPVAPNALICALSTKGLQQTKQTNTAVIPDCDDPVAVVPLRRTVISKDCQMTGEGFYDPDMRQDIQDLYDLDASQTMSFEIKSDPPSAGTDGYYTGKWFFTELGINAEFGQFGRSNMTFEADGEITWVAAP